MSGKTSPQTSKKERILPKLQRELSLFLLFLGSFLCLEGYFAPGLPAAALAATAGACAIGAELMHYGKIQKLLAFLLFWLFWGILALKKQHLLADGAKELANRALYLINRYYRTDYLYWYVGLAGEGKQWLFLFFCSLLGFLGGLFLSLAKKNRGRNLAALSVPLTAVFAGLALGRVPSLAGMLLALAGFFVLQLDLLARGTWAIGLCMGLSLGAAVLAARGSFFQGLLETYHGPWLKRQLQLEDRMLDFVGQFSGIRLFSGKKAQKEFPLGNGKPKQEGKEILRITVDRRPEQTVYLRGFVGGDYGGGRWESAPKQEFSDWAQKQGLSAGECMEFVQNFPYQKFLGMEEGMGGSVPRKVKIDLAAPTSGYTLIPYFTKIPEGQPMEGDGALSPSGKKNFQWDSFLYQEMFLSLGGYQQEYEEKEAAGEEGLWGLYTSYAQQVYTRLPEQGLERLQALADEYGNQWFDESQLGMEDGAEPEISQPETGTAEGTEGQPETGTAAETGNQPAEEGRDLAVRERWEKILHVMGLLWDNAAYSQELGPLPEGEDFAEYFLLGQKKGYCVHFATAGTLALRMYGVPARYAAGYVVFPEDFKENSDGTFTASVTDMRGHAWAEIFEEGAGFVPLELTPPSYFPALQELGEGESIEDAVRKLEHGEDGGGGRAERQETEPAQERLPKEEEEPQKEGEEGQKPQATAGDAQKGQENGTKPGKGEEGILAAIQGRFSAALKGMQGALAKIPLAGKIAGSCLAASAAVYLLFYRRKRRKTQRQQAKFFQKDRTKGALALGAAMEPMLKKLGLVPKPGQGEQEYAKFLEEALPGMGWERTMSLLQKAAFSEHGVTEEEFQEIAGAYRKLERKVREFQKRKP